MQLLIYLGAIGIQRLIPAKSSSTIITREFYCKKLTGNDNRLILAEFSHKIPGQLNYDVLDIMLHLISLQDSNSINSIFSNLSEFFFSSNLLCDGVLLLIENTSLVILSSEFDILKAFLSIRSRI